MRTSPLIHHCYANVAHELRTPYINPAFTHQGSQRFIVSILLDPRHPISRLLNQNPLRFVMGSFRDDHTQDTVF